MTGNEIISYSFFLEGNPPVFITSENMLSAFRPVVNTELMLPGDRRIYKVLRVDPDSNPNNQSNGYYLVDVKSKAAPMKFTGMDAKGL